MGGPGAGWCSREKTKKGNKLKKRGGYILYPPSKCYLFPNVFFFILDIYFYLIGHVAVGMVGESIQLLLEMMMIVVVVGGM